MPDAASVVLLVRHGLTPTTGIKLPGRAPGLHLSDEGRRQAEVAAERIGKVGKIAAVYASPITRARETAQPIARAVKRAVRIERDLADLDIGDWTGMSLKQTTSVKIGNVTLGPGVFNVISDTQVTATVPQTVSPAKVSLKTKGGSAIARGSFTIQ